MKGIELPINALIIIAVALIVLLGITLLWISGWGGGAQGVTIEAAKAAGCAALMRSAGGCIGADTDLIIYDGQNLANHVLRFDANGNGGFDAGDTLQRLCQRYYNVAASDKAACRKICGCGG